MADGRGPNIARVDGPDPATEIPLELNLPID